MPDSARDPTSIGLGLLDERPPPEIATWIPRWVAFLGTAVWLCSPDLRIVHVNSRAESLFRSAGRTLIGETCYGAIRGRNANGEPYCRAECPLLLNAARRQPIEPFELHVGPPPRHAASILTIPLTAPDRSYPWLLHCAAPLEARSRAEEFISRIAARSPGVDGPRPGRMLTPRELEILQLLSVDRDLESIAETLCVSHVTVRNHVQHILQKLGAHSLIEAVARYLI